MAVMKLVFPIAARDHYERKDQLATVTLESVAQNYLRSFTSDVVTNSVTVSRHRSPE